MHIQVFLPPANRGQRLKLPICLPGKQNPLRKEQTLRGEEFAIPGANPFPQESTTIQEGGGGSNENRPDMQSYTLSPLGP